MIPGLSMSPLEILAVLGAAALVLARWFPARARRPVQLSGIAIVLATGIALALLGPRWQLVPLFLFSALALVTMAVAALLRRRSGREPRRAKWWLVLPGTAACLLLIAATPVAAWAMPVPVYPEPTGEYAVGTTTFQWTDPNRPEPFSPAPDDNRTIVVQLWYPAAQSASDVERAFGGRATVEESRAVFEASAEFFGIPGFLVDEVAEVRSHAVFDAPVAEENTRYPVIVFSPGLSATRTTNTVLAEEWASNGYVVAIVDHTYDAAITFIDGEPVLSRNTVGDTDAETAQMNRDNLAMRIADLSFVLTRIERLDRAATPGTLAGRLDTDRAAVAGHSRGAAAALMMLADEPRFDAAIHIDGGLEPTMPAQPYDQPVLSITSPVSEADNPDYIPNLERVLDLGTGETDRIELAGAGHFSFTDAALYFPPLPSVLGTIGRTEGLRLTAGATTEFLDAQLR
jgi:predicted dienelactone hydrolase